MSIFNFKPKFNTATEHVIYILKTRGKIDQKECNDKGITSRLGGMIHRLRKQGMDITTEEKQIITRYGETSRVAIYHYKENDQRNRRLR